MHDRSVLDVAKLVLGPAEFECLEASLRRPLVPALRANTLKIGADEAVENWPLWYDWNLSPIPFCPTGWRIENPTGNLARTPDFKLGRYYLQDAASMLPAELFAMGAASEHPLVLDMAAAPGGKTTHVVSRTRDQGLTIANDSSSSRIIPLRTTLQDWGATNIAITQTPGELWGDWFPETFDMILLDAPCSGRSLRTADRRRPRPISAKRLLDIQAAQSCLLESAFKDVKPGGQIVYSTCTLAPEENEAVIDGLLSRHRGAKVLSASHIITAPALVNAGDHSFRPSVARAVRLWPHLFDTAGFFAALVGKDDSLESPATPYPNGTLYQRGFQPLATHERIELVRSFDTQYGFDLTHVSEQYDLELWGRGQSVYAISARFLSKFGNLSTISAGMMVAEMDDRKLTPSHEFVSRFGHQFSSGRLTISVEQAKQWLQGYEIRGTAPSGLEIGSVILLDDELGRPLGRGKLLANRIRNLLPRRLLY